MKYFLFDIGNVLADFSDDEFLSVVTASTHHPVATVTARDHALDDLVEKGLISDEEYVVKLNASKGLNWSLEELTAAWSRVFTQNETGRRLFNEALQAGIPVYMLSNIAGFHVDAIRNNWPAFFDGASGLFLSYRLGVRKPDPQIYRHVLEELGAEAERCFFIDDLAGNVESARGLGMHAYRFAPENHAEIQAAARAFFGY